MYTALARLVDNRGIITGYRVINLETLEVEILTCNRVNVLDRRYFTNTRIKNGILILNNSDKLPAVSSEDGSPLDSTEILEVVYAKTIDHGAYMYGIVNKHGYVMECGIKDIINIQYKNRDVIVGFEIGISKLFYYDFDHIKVINTDTRPIDQRTRYIGQYMYKYNTDKNSHGRGLYGYTAMYTGNNTEVAKAPLESIDGIPVVSLSKCFRGSHIPKAIDFSDFNSDSILSMNNAIEGEGGTHIECIVFGEKFNIEDIPMKFSMISGMDIDYLVFRNNIKISNKGESVYMINNSTIQNISDMIIEPRIRGIIARRIKNCNIGNLKIKSNGLSLQRTMHGLMDDCSIENLDIDAVIGERVSGFLDYAKQKAFRISTLSNLKDINSVLENNEDMRYIINNVSESVTLSGTEEELSIIKSKIERCKVLGLPIAGIESLDIRYKTV